jgi:hypothetical protein
MRAHSPGVKALATDDSSWLESRGTWHTFNQKNKLKVEIDALF